MEQRPAFAAERICPSDTLDRPNKDRRHVTFNDQMQETQFFYGCIHLLFHTVSCIL